MCATVRFLVPEMKNSTQNVDLKSYIFLLITYIAPKSDNMSFICMQSGQFLWETIEGTVRTLHWPTLYSIYSSGCWCLCYSHAFDVILKSACQCYL